MKLKNVGFVFAYYDGREENVESLNSKECFFLFCLING